MPSTSAQYWLLALLRCWPTYVHHHRGTAIFCLSMKQTSTCFRHLTGLMLATRGCQARGQICQKYGTIAALSQHMRISSSVL